MKREKEYGTYFLPIIATKHVGRRGNTYNKLINLPPLKKIK